jgi:hypothetical protein
MGVKLWMGVRVPNRTMGNGDCQLFTLTTHYTETFYKGSVPKSVRSLPRFIAIRPLVHHTEWVAPLYDNPLCNCFDTFARNTAIILTYILSLQYIALGTNWECLIGHLLNPVFVVGTHRDESGKSDNEVPTRHPDKAQLQLPNEDLFLALGIKFLISSSATPRGTNRASSLGF